MAEITRHYFSFSYSILAQKSRIKNNDAANIDNFLPEAGLEFYYSISVLKLHQNNFIFKKLALHKSGRNYPRPWQPASYVAINAYLQKVNSPLPPGVLPSEQDAVQIYRSTGHQLTDEWSFGTDPLEGQNDKQALRDNSFWLEVETRFGGTRGLAKEIANHRYTTYHYCILRYVQLSEQLAIQWSVILIHIYPSFA